MSGRAERYIFPVGDEVRVGTQALRDLFGLALLDGRSSGHHVVIVLERDFNGFIKRDPNRPLGLAKSGQGRQGASDEYGQPCKPRTNPARWRRGMPRSQRIPPVWEVRRLRPRTRHRALAK